MHSIRIDYERRDHCPLCGAGGTPAGVLSFGAYVFGDSRIAYPPDGPPRLLRCPRCSLVFKRDVPVPEALAALFQQVAAKVWTTHGYRFLGIRKLVARTTGRAPTFDLLDVGSGDGKMLEFFESSIGRRSGLDVFHNPACARRVRGEYIQGFVDGDLTWSGRPYDVALALDVFEHLYDPRRAFENLERLVRPGGTVVIQTGNAWYPKSKEMDMGDWWYANLFDHHVFWSPETFAHVESNGRWKVESLTESVHKDGPEIPATKRAAVRALRGLGRIAPVRHTANALLRRDVRLLAEPGARDHLDCVLRRA